MLTSLCHVLVAAVSGRPVRPKQLVCSHKASQQSETRDTTGYDRTTEIHRITTAFVHRKCRLSPYDAYELLRPGSGSAVMLRA
jgi:hypothetical protein